MEEQQFDQQVVTTPKKHIPFLTTFSSLRHRNYRLFFFGQMISLIGTWMQWTAQGWLVYKMTGSKFMLGFIGMIGPLPLALLSVFGGVVADRFRRKSILIVTQSLAMVPPLILATLVLTDTVQVWHIAVLAASLGVIVSFDMPARQAFVIEMVGRGDLLNAIGLNSGIFNSARIVGPAVAGIVMAKTMTKDNPLSGMGYCFLINGFSYVVVIVALFMIRPRTSGAPRHPGSPLRRMAAGFSFVKKDHRLLGLMGLLAIIGVFGFSYTRLLPAFARDTFGVDELGYGQLLTFNGVGAIVGSLIVASMAKRRGKRRILFLGIFLFCVALIAFSRTAEFAFAALFLLFMGTGLIMFFSTANTLVQTVVPDELRGRIMGIWTFVFGGSIPVGSIVVGTAAEHLGLARTVQIGAAICAAAAIAAMTVAWKIKPPAESPQTPQTPELQSP